MKVVCYYRHSTDKQQQDKMSIERQQFECRKWVDEQGWHIVEEVADKGLSGAGDKKNLELLQKGVDSGDLKFDALLVYDYARITRKNVLRTMEDIGFLDRAGIGIVSVEKRDIYPRAVVDDLGRDMHFLFEGYQNHEEVIKAANRSVSGLTAAHQRGVLSWVGATPLGFNKVQRDGITVLQANDDLRFVTEMFRQFLDGSSIRSLVPLLEQSSRFDGVTDKNPSSQSVKNILRNPIYCGIWAFGLRNVGKWRTMNPKKKKNLYGVNVLENAASVIEYDVEKAVSKADFLKVQALLDESQKKHKGAPASAGHKYTGLLKCACCGGAVVAHKRRWKKNGQSQEHLVDYVCAASSQSGRKCRSGEKPWRKSIPEQELDNHLQMMFGTRLIRSGQFHVALVETLAEELRLKSGGSTDIEEQIAELTIELKKCENSFALMDGTPPSAFMRHWQELEEQKKELQQQQQQAESGFGICSLVESGIQQQAAAGNPQFERYLLAMLDLSKKLATEPEFDFVQQIPDLVEKAIYVDGAEVDLLVNDSDEVEGFYFPADAILDLLKSIGLEKIDVDWDHGVKRGKPQQVPMTLGFDFIERDSVTYMKHTRTAVFEICDETFRWEVCGTTSLKKEDQ